MGFTFECPDCNSKTEYSSESEDVNTTSTIVCPSCQTLHDVVNTDSENEKIHTTKSKYDKTNYRNKIAGITNQLEMTRGSRATSLYNVPCPQCLHNWEMQGIPIKSVHQCSKCYGYFRIDDVKVTILSREKQFKHSFQVSAIYSTSIFDHDIDKLADFWSNRNLNQALVE